MASVKMLTPNKICGQRHLAAEIGYRLLLQGKQPVLFADHALTAGPGKLYLINPLRISLDKGAKEAMKRYLPV
jgi:hypothetical protein